MSIYEGKLREVECLEDHLFQPFSNGNDGAASTVSQKLVFVGEEKRTLKEPSFTTKTQLKFIHNHERADGGADEEHVNQLLQDFSRVKKSEIPSLFNNLVYSLRNLNHVQLVKTYDGIEHQDVKRFFLDALPILKTDAGVNLMRYIIQQGTLSNQTINSWFTSLAFYKNPTRPMISTLSTLLDDPRQSTILGISSLTRTYCDANEGCSTIPEVQEIIRVLESFLGDYCEASSVKEEEHIVLTLKGLRNIGLIQTGKDTLRKCYQTKSNSIWIRLAALETTRKLSCDIVKEDFGLMRLLKDRQEDSELRIGAYLANFDCPSDIFIQNVKLLLAEEEVNQVGSFIWTHLTNIQETKSRDDWKKDLKNYVGIGELMAKFDLDHRKFSRNIEFSYFSKDLRIGSTIDSNIVFSEKSYIPKSGMLNLTANIFGENINMFEIGARFEGFEDLVEEIFGPNGYFREDSIHKFIKSMRTKRSVDESDILGVQELFGSEAKIDEPRGNMYMRMFGKDLYYNSFNGLNSMLNQTLLKPLSKFGFEFGVNEIDYSRSNMFLDGCIIVPTLTGMPLNLTVNGTSTVRLETETDLNIKKLFQTGEATLSAKLYPTVTLEVSALMSVDSFVAKTGLKSNTKLHSSIYANVFVDINRGRKLKVHVNLPTDKTEVIDVTSEFLTFESGKFKKLVPKYPEQSMDICSSKFASDIFGLELCAVGKYHKSNGKFTPAWYFFGPAKVEINLRKTDKFEKLTFDYTWVTDDSKPEKGIMEDFKLIIDTPGSLRNRKVYAQLKFDDINSYFLFDLNMPIRKTQLELKFDWRSNKKLLSGFMFNEGTEVFTVLGDIETFSMKHEANAKLYIRGDQMLNWKGVVYSNSNKFNLNAELQGSFHQPIVVKADYVKSKEKVLLSGTLASGGVRLELKSKSEITLDSLRTKALLKYDVPSYGKGSVDLAAKIRDVQQGLLVTKIISFDIKVRIFCAYKTLDFQTDFTLHNLKT